MASSHVAFFDIDKTLLRVNSAKLWIQFELKRRSISPWQAGRAAIWAGLYELGVVDVERVLREAVAQLEGRRESDTRAETEEFFRTRILQTFRPGAREAVTAHKERGDRVVLLTSSSNYMSKLVCAELGCNDFLCNRFEVQDDVFTGDPIEPLCYGAGKLVHATRWVDAHDASLEDASFYTDSYTDLPVLEAVSDPYVVHPDPRLRREAARRDWPILDWE